MKTEGAEKKGNKGRARRRTEKAEGRRKGAKQQEAECSLSLSLSLSHGSHCETTTESMTTLDY